MREIGDPKAIFNPKTVALIGASDKPGSVGRAILENLTLFKQGKTFPVNPNRKEVLGFPCYSAIANLPESIDLAVIATPAPTVPALVEEFGRKRVHGIVIISAGFWEALFFQGKETHPGL